MKYVVSRHAGALQWCRLQGINADKTVAHLDPSNICPGDMVIGTLPLPLAAQVQANGGRYLHLTLPLPADLRGQELTAEQMTALGATLQEFCVKAL